MAKTGMFFNDRVFFIVQAMVKYIPFDWGINFRSFLYRRFFKKFGKRVRIKDGTTFKFPSEIELGDDCTIGEFCYFVGRSGLKICNNLLIGAGSKITTSSHVCATRDRPISVQGISFIPVELERDVWLGFDVKILAGSYIAKGCIVGAGALVNKRFNEPYKIILGMPATVHGERPK